MIAQVPSSIGLPDPPCLFGFQRPSTHLDGGSVGCEAGPAVTFSVLAIVTVAVLAISLALTGARTGQGQRFEIRSGLSRSY